MNYEGVFIFNPNLTPDALKKETQIVVDYIKNQGGNVKNTTELGRRKLGALIGKNHEGNFVVVQFDTKPDTLARLNQLFRLDEALLRFMITVVTFKRPPKVRTRKPRENAENLA